MQEGKGFGDAHEYLYLGLEAVQPNRVPILAQRGVVFVGDQGQSPLVAQPLHHRVGVDRLQLGVRALLQPVGVVQLLLHGQVIALEALHVDFGADEYLPLVDLVQLGGG